MEEDLSIKMSEFMSVIDQVKKYRALLSALPTFIIIMGLSIIVALSADIANRFAIVYVTYININPTIGNTITLLSLIIGVVIGFFWVNRRINRVKVGQWKTTLNEGAPGAIKVLLDIDWNDVFSDIRYAKLGFWLHGILKTAAYWLLAFVISLFMAEYVGNFLHWDYNLVVLAMFSLALVLALSKKDIQKRFDQVGRLDALLWELRWFDNDFRRKDFEA